MKRIFAAMLLCVVTVCSAAAQNIEIANRLTDDDIAMATAATRDFFASWFTERNINKAASYLSLDDEYKRRVMRDAQLGNEKEIDAWFKKTLVLLLLSRRDAVTNAALSANKRYSGYEQLPTSTAGVVGLIMPQHALTAAEISGMFFGEVIITTVVLRHSPDGHITIVFGRKSGDWKIVNFLLSNK